jgi:hypothetical protein
LRESPSDTNNPDWSQDCSVWADQDRNVRVSLRSFANHFASSVVNPQLATHNPMKTKHILLLAIMMLYVLPSLGQTAAVTLRPSHIDISSAEAQSAVLMTLAQYPVDDVRYRLYSGSNQYFPWNAETGEYISSSVYANGPKAPGTPTTSSSFWIMFRRGTNNSTAANYRDRIGPGYGPDNHITTALPAAIQITDAFYVTHDQVNFTHTGYTSKFVVLGYDQEEGGTLITATSTDLETGNFSLTGPVGVVLKRIELRTATNELIESKTGQWPAVQQVVTPAFDPEPSIYRGSRTVTITTTTDDAQIRYTLNGEEPDETSALYTDPVEITSSTTLIAKAFKDGYINSETESGYYRILNDEHWETFNGMEHTTTAYRDGTFLGEDGSEWIYVGCAGSIQITGQAITIARNRDPQSYVQSGTIAGGVGTIDFNYMQAFSTDVNLGVYVNDQLAGTVTSSGEQNVVKHSGPIEVNIPGNVVLKFINIENSAGQVVIDDVIWTGFDDPTAVTKPAQPESPEAIAHIYAQQHMLVIDFLRDASSDRMLEVYDLSGRKLLNKAIGNIPQHRQPLDLNPGIYLIRISDATTIQTERIFIR